jgi:hypothetical protein
MAASLSYDSVCITPFLFLRPPQELALWADASSSTSFYISRIIATQSLEFSDHTKIERIGNTPPLLGSDTFTILNDAVHFTVKRG